MESRHVRSGSVVLVGVFLIGAGCGVEKQPGVADGDDVGGKLQVALRAATPEGTTYHVEHAVLDIFNYDGLCASYPCVSVPGDDDTVAVDLTASVNPQDYVITLEPGWTVARVEADGSETPVEATLLESSIAFTIKPNRTTPVSFQFQIDGVVATTGTGTVAVKPQFLETLIDDFEDGDDQVAPFGGRNGRWIAFNDGSGVETPAPGPALPQVLDTTANEWMHLTGRGFGPAGRLLPDGTFSYGAGVTANLVVDPVTGIGKPYDASATTGVGFKFVMGSTVSAPVILSFYVQTSATTPIDHGGTCPFNCYDGFGVNGAVPYDPNGFAFSGVVPWEAMHQVGYGTPALFDPATIMSVNFLVSFADLGQPLTSNVFDLAIDDVVFAPGTFSFPPAGGGSDAGPPPGDDAGPPPGDDAGPPPEDGGAPSEDAGPPPKGPPGKDPGPPIGPKAARALAVPTWSW